jgi:hypothetical protein
LLKIASNGQSNRRRIVAAPLLDEKELEASVLLEISRMRA